MKDIRVGMVGAGFMGKLHSIAFTIYTMHFWPVAARPVLQEVADLAEDLAKDAAARYGYQRYSTDWKAMVAKDDIDLVDVITPNNSHKEIVLEVIRNKKDVYCEKPLAMNAKDARVMLEAAQSAGVIHAIGFNNRSIPTILLAKKILDAGLIGEVYSYRSQYMQDYANDPGCQIEWRYDAEVAGSGVVTDLGSHAIDLSRFLLGDIKKVVAQRKIVIKKRPVGEPTCMGVKSDKILGYKDVTSDDQMSFICEYNNGVQGAFQASRVADGNKNALEFELYGSKGALGFSNTRLCELDYYCGTDPDDLQGYRTIKIDPNHPKGEAFWPVGDMGMGYADNKSCEISFLMDAIASRDQSIVNADFEDGYKAMLVVDAILESIASDKWVTISY